MGKEKPVILHITGASDGLGSGVADYCDKLVSAQRDTCHADAYYVLSGDSNKGKTGERHKVALPVWSADKAENEKALEGIERQVRKDFPGRDVLWYVHLAAPRCGTVVSPEWLSNRHVAGTVHECKIPPSSDVSHAQEAAAEIGKAQQKYTQTLEYASTFSACLISNKSEADALDAGGMRGLKKVQSIPPNLDPRTVHLDPVSGRDNVVVHFGMIRKGKGISDVLDMQTELDSRGSGITTKLFGKVEHDQLPTFCEVLCKIYGGPGAVNGALKGTKYEDLLNDGLDDAKRKTYANEAAEINNMLKGKCTQAIGVDFYPNAPEHDILEALNRSKAAYLPFDRGATFHSGSLPTCVLSGVAVVTTRGEHTPKSYLDNLQMVDTPSSPSSVARQIEHLVKTPGALEGQLEKQKELLGLYPTWGNVANASMEVVKDAHSMSKFQTLARAAREEFRRTSQEAEQNKAKARDSDTVVVRKPTPRGQQGRNVFG